MRKQIITNILPETRYYTSKRLAEEYRDRLESFGFKVRFTITSKKAEGISKQDYILWKVKVVN